MKDPGSPCYKKENELLYDQDISNLKILNYFINRQLNTGHTHKWLILAT